MVSYLDVATIDSTSHLDGRLSLVNRDGLSALLEPGLTVHFVPPKIDVIRSAHVKSVDFDSEFKAIVRFDEVDNIDVAEELVGMHCLIDRECIKGHEALIESAIQGKFDGWSFLDETTGSLGSILRSWSASGNVLGEVVLDNENEENAVHMIPLADELIIDFDDESKKLVLKLPNGIFDL